MLFNNAVVDFMMLHMAQHKSVSVQNNTRVIVPQFITSFNVDEITAERIIQRNMQDWSKDYNILGFNYTLKKQ